MINLQQVPQELKKKVVRLIDRGGLDEFTIGTAAAGLAVEGFKQAHPELDMSTFEKEVQYKTRIALEELCPNFQAYFDLAAEVYEESLDNDINQLLGGIVTALFGPNVEVKNWDWPDHLVEPPTGDTLAEREAQTAPEGDFVPTVEAVPVQDQLNIEEQADNDATGFKDSCAGFRN